MERGDGSRMGVGVGGRYFSRREKNRKRRIIRRVFKAFNF